MAHSPTDSLVVPTIRLDKGEGLAEALRCLREFNPRVFLIFGGDPEDVQWLHETLEDQAGHPILLAADLERGAGQQFDGLTPLPDAWALGLLGPEAAYEAGHRTAAEAATANVRWILGPCLDLHRTSPEAIASPIIANRSFGGDIQKVIECAGAFIKGVQDAGGISCGKHFPGHGACGQDSHTELAVAFDDIEIHLEPYKALVQKMPSVMVGHIEFPMIDESGAPASRSKTIMNLLRENLQYNGLVITDSINMVGFGEPQEELAIEAINAGVDILLDPKDPIALAMSLRDALQRGDISEERLHQSTMRLDKIIRQSLDTEAANVKPLVLGGSMKSLLRPLPSGSGGRTHPRPALALNLASTPDANRFLEEWGIPILKPEEEPPQEFPGPLLILCGAREGHGLPDIPGNWLEAIHHHHPRIYMAGSPNAVDIAPAAARGWYVPGLSPALLGMLLTADEKEA
mgnify:CR=1 FL=1